MHIVSIQKILFITLVLFCVSSHDVDAATLRVTPNTGVYTVGKQFTLSVALNTDGKPVNASDGQLTFNPRELQVIAVSRASSIFNLWTEEPTFSNSQGVISFGGGSPTGYTGTTGSIVTVTFKALGAGTPKVVFKSGSVLAADGLGTNVLSGMSGGSYTISAPTSNPEPEYIAPANTPKAPVVASETHPNQTAWYKEKTAKLTWDLPGDVVAIRTLLDSEPTTIPTIVYEDRISSKTIDTLSEGISYFHIQFKNKEGWGKIAHYKLSVDSNTPTDFTVKEEKGTNPDEPALSLVFTIADISPITEYKIQIDGKDPLVFKDEKLSKKYPLESLAPGYHTVIVEAFDSAGNSTIASHSFSVEAFEKPIFTNYPSRINTEVIPALQGTTRPNSEVSISVAQLNDSGELQLPQAARTTVSDAEGKFTYIPNSTFMRGVYSITAIARDEKGNQSEPSDPIKIIVETPGYFVFGTFIVNLLSVVVPLVSLVLLLGFGTWYLWYRLIRWQKKIRKEAHEAEDSLTIEFHTIVSNLNKSVDVLKESRKGKLTKQEADLIEQIEKDLQKAKERIRNEIEDIEDIVS